MDRFKQAEEHYKLAIDTYEKILGQLHPETAQGYMNIGEFYFTQNDFKLAKLYYTKAMKIWQGRRDTGSIERMKVCKSRIADSN